MPSNLFSHGGGLNSEGCHNNKKTDDYHCHRKKKTIKKNYSMKKNKKLLVKIIIENHISINLIHQIQT